MLRSRRCQVVYQQDNRGDHEDEASLYHALITRIRFRVDRDDAHVDHQILNQTVQFYQVA